MSCWVLFGVQKSRGSGDGSGSFLPPLDRVKPVPDVVGCCVRTRPAVLPSFLFDELLFREHLPADHIPMSAALRADMQSRCLLQASWETRRVLHASFLFFVSVYVRNCTY